MRAVTDVAWAWQGSSGLGRLGCWPMAINSGHQWLFSGLAAHRRLVLSPRPCPCQPWIPPLGGLCLGQCHSKVAVPRKWQTLAHPSRPWQMSTLTMPSGVRSSPSGAAPSPTHLSHLPPTLGPTGAHVAPSTAEVGLGQGGRCIRRRPHSLAPCPGAVPAAAVSARDPSAPPSRLCFPQAVPSFG